jgi:sugar/nucleoside kinase (ribokinase family)
VTEQIAGAPSRRREVLVFGAYFADLVFQELPERVSPGREVFAEGFSMMPGGAFTPAMALHRLGHDVVWAADFGDDVFSKHVLAAARAEGLDESGFRHHPFALRRVTVALSSRGDRALVSYQDPVCPRSLSVLLREYRPRVAMLTELQYGTGVLAALRMAHQIGSLVFMDCQDVPGSLDTPLVRETLAEVDVFAPNADEALRLTGTGTVDDALDMLTGLVQTVVIKRGSAGATAFQAGTRCDIDAVKVAAVDTTGAGDCFNAGFVHARLAGRQIWQCLAAAVACGAVAVTAPGSSAAPDEAGLESWLSRVPYPS